MKLIQETKFLDTRKRGAGVLPLYIAEAFSNHEISYFSKDLINLSFIWFYRDITFFLKNTKIYNLYKLRNTGTLYYSRSLNELDLNESLMGKYLIIKDQIVGNGFYYCKYHNQRYLPTYFSQYYRYKEELPKKYKYGIYLRDECPKDDTYLKEFLKKNNHNPKDVLIFGKSGMFSERNCTLNQTYFFNSIENYLVVSTQDDSVPGTLLEVIRNKIPTILLNELQPASGTKEILEGYSYFGYNKFFTLLDKLNTIIWKQDPTDNINKINNYFKRSKTFIDFLKFIEKE